MGRNGKWDRFLAVILIVAVIVTPHGVTLIAGFVVVLQRTEDRLIEKYKKIVCNSPML